MITRIFVTSKDISIIAGTTVKGCDYIKKQIRKTQSLTGKDRIQFKHLASYWKCSEEEIKRALEKAGISR